ncbi:unnamed protein product [Rotaria magnacalcarata]|uniref:Uncharacterized protein n=1 Tax=Rotaria magnacalcarata TaxID=392030 RepID=A0A820LQA4_9BILA|nr:unnamed protein product [Rotaria magnacalcarata]CAF4361245.1 unnamed protein product [Rotaria magnacalcarata]
MVKRHVALAWPGCISSAYYSKQVGSSKVGSSKVGSMFTKSDRVSWNAQDGNLIASHFNKYVTDTTYLDAKGKLPRPLLVLHWY